jgi:2-polyprenyl-6-methoxyphenol hydroxylase-like FAD-dependent oxidoreductase
MADIVLTGGGICGLNAAMLLAKDGHQVTVLERDPSPPPESPEQAWACWERRGVNQFRLPHFFLSRFRILLERELPEAVAALERAGALRINPIANAPDFVTGGPREGDEQFESITGRRPVMEAAIANEAAATPGITLRRGVAAAGLITNGSAAAGVPHVVGVATGEGEEIRADLVVDATGRRSPLPGWLEAIGARPPYEEQDDSGFIYYGRTFRSRDGSLPAALGPPLQHYDSLSILALPADNGSWALALITSAGDSALRALRDIETWTTVFGSYPLVAHWLEGEPFEPEIKVMAKIEDRYRRFVVDGAPVVTGVLPVADSWACTNPSFGRGASMALIHAVALRDLVRDGPLDDPVAFATAWDEVTESTVAPWYRETLWMDHHRLAEIDASIQGQAYEPDDRKYELYKALGSGGGADPDVLRAFVRNAALLAVLDDVIDEFGPDRLLSAGGGWREAPSLGPSREELEKLVGV